MVTSYSPSSIKSELGHLSHQGPTLIHPQKVMNASKRLLASATSARGGNGLRPEPLALLPPIPLYRRLFRAHRKHLPPQMRVLGDEYIKHEFRAHRNVDNPAHLVNAQQCSQSIISIILLT